jgi:hypothetical protein
MKGGEMECDGWTPSSHRGKMERRHIYMMDGILEKISQKKGKKIGNLG